MRQLAHHGLQNLKALTKHGFSYSLRFLVWYGISS
jgi:hypothetical protein